MGGGGGAFAIGPAAAAEVGAAVPKTVASAVADSQAFLDCPRALLQKGVLPSLVKFEVFGVC